MSFNGGGGGGWRRSEVKIITTKSLFQNLHESEMVLWIPVDIYL